MLFIERSELHKSIHSSSTYPTFSNHTFMSSTADSEPCMTPATVPDWRFRTCPRNEIAAQNLYIISKLYTKVSRQHIIMMNF